MGKPDAATAGPVFFDPAGRRRLGLHVVAAVVVGAACALTAGVVIGLTAPPQAPPTSVAAVALARPGTAAGGADTASPASTSAASQPAPTRHSAAKHKAPKDSGRRATAHRTTRGHKTSKGATRRRAGR